ncbi:hypothetical protein PRIPAC_79281 [Pristionchus pacificus]|uniref:Uncharacterized protein n=1 Tax=Pristionchus pacificus TaxID=54126 RepID=A0A2A6C3G9_PRIPA|nr:hypothetical protein PRIPAC_79281 [Pristionchus pacificus]|eukprot:PDM72782.1 hypothetical protein PRIPAC_39216 [Pristionchus pacificus]
MIAYLFILYYRKQTCSLPPAINPVLTLFFVRPYRRLIVQNTCWESHDGRLISISVGPSN